MSDPPENLSRPETNLTPADAEPASAADTADFAKRLEEFEAETRSLIGDRQALRKFTSVCIFLVLLGLYSIIAPVDFVILGTVFFVVGAGLLLILTMWNRDMYAGPSKETLRLTEYCNPQAIGALLARLHGCPSRKEKKLVWQTIANVLRRVQPEEADALPRDVCDRFNRHLTTIYRSIKCTSEQVDFCLAWLKVLEQIGGKRDFQTVSHIATISLAGEFYNTIRDAARDCLPHIEARIAAQEPGRTLLRASTSPPDSGKTLLRPAAKSNPTAPDELLRPAELEDEV